MRPLASKDKSSQVVTLGLTGGGTAGHVWPHLALFDVPDGVLQSAFADGRLQVVYFGSKGGMEEGLVTAAMGSKWRYIALPAGKLRRYFSWRNFSDAFLVVAGFLEALRVLRKLRVNLVFSKGGFVAAPVVWAAWLLRIPVVIHESDVTPALATRMSLPFAKAIVCSFADTMDLLPRSVRGRVQPLGLPLRRSLFSASRAEGAGFFGLDQGSTAKPVLLVFGGSLGAEVLNTAVRASLTRLLELFQVIHIVGKNKSYVPQVAGEAASRYHQFEFLHDEMRLAYAAADVVLSRAGASSLFELAAARIPMVVVPLGLNQSRGDQIVNAEVFRKRGWATVIPETELDSRRLIAVLESLVPSQGRAAARQRLSSAPGPDAAERVAQLLSGFLWKDGDLAPSGITVVGDGDQTHD
jgi:UDP-N-acetylglucosamine--N-acetylmuramyl-(pentapeptide) pyrophosphoryl-undecaprenol N-acetylglucosamine transferase